MRFFEHRESSNIEEVLNSDGLTHAIGGRHPNEVNSKGTRYRYPGSVGSLEKDLPNTRRSALPIRASALDTFRKCSSEVSPPLSSPCGPIYDYTLSHRTSPPSNHTFVACCHCRATSCTRTFETRELPQFGDAEACYDVESSRDLARNESEHDHTSRDIPGPCSVGDITGSASRIDSRIRDRPPCVLERVVRS